MVLTPFLLMGAMSPVTIPAALTQQLAEALSGIALAQLIRPGCPVIFGSFLSNIDMQSGSPSFGTPESAIGLLCTGQLARHYGLPFRTGGGLNSSQTADAQSAYEALMTLLPTFLAGTNFVMHAAGWLEGGLVSCYEKFIIDIELLRELRVEFTPLEITEESLAFGAHEEVGHGGHFLGAEHTMERFRDCFQRPMALLHRQLRALAQAGRQGHRRPGRRDLAQEAGIVRGAAAGRRHPRRARRLRDPPPPRTRRLAPTAARGPGAYDGRYAWQRRNAGGLRWACDGIGRSWCGVRQPGRPGALGFTRAPALARIRWCFRTGGLLAVIGLLRVAAAVLPRWRLLLAGVVLTATGVILRSGPFSVVMLPGMVLMVAAAFTQTWPEEARTRRRALERELAAYSTPDQRCDLEATLDRYPDSATGELREILARQAAAATAPPSAVSSPYG